MRTGLHRKIPANREKQGKTRKQAGPSKPKLEQICNINDLPDIPLIARTGIITGATRES